METGREQFEPAGLACLLVARIRLARFAETQEHVFVEAFVAKFADEALDEGVLHRLARLDVVPPGRNARRALARGGLELGRAQ